MEGELLAGFCITEANVVDRTDDLRAGNIESIGSEEVLLFYLREVRVSMYVTRCAPWTRGECGYLDLLNPAAVDAFMVAGRTVRVPSRMK